MKNKMDRKDQKQPQLDLLNPPPSLHQAHVQIQTLLPDARPTLLNTDDGKNTLLTTDKERVVVHPHTHLLNPPPALRNPSAQIQTHLPPQTESKQTTATAPSQITLLTPPPQIQKTGVPPVDG